MHWRRTTGDDAASIYNCKRDPDADKTEEQGGYYSRKKIAVNEGLRQRVEFERRNASNKQCKGQCHAALVAGGGKNDTQKLKWKRARRWY